MSKKPDLRKDPRTKNNRPDVFGVSGQVVTCGSIRGCGGTGRKKGRTCARCAGKGFLMKRGG